ncbi:Gluconate 2-dehydrogenase subunit 3 [Catalinimonas alkaloidigena]|uniref:Gluconate 2-dehydrogenase subunit 3 n=1 Tax=Catalinimonas alkaloidigena TaxID=1075417 RepID=A0A1G9R303_9BACT|nr:gluconate 2-dehydrogenase subunit 3 family protein [Catalinimonas alkaloidigena]SDM17682.1 Gluconate 2-dehydrogenase subunit 3 [Catalinimonas alkaloidigena]
MINRREALARVALIMGGTVVGAEAFLSGCTNSPEQVANILDFTPDTVALLDEVGETILPTTASSPGAKAAKIGDFMKVIVTDCYDEKDQKTFAKGVEEIDKAADKEYGKAFVALSDDQKQELLIALDKEAKGYQPKEGESPHYFTLIKQLTLWGYFTSEVGATKALRYLPVPGRYDGCVPYEKGEKAWAL